MNHPLLAADRLSVQYPGNNGLLNAITDITLHIRPGETVCLVGESGSGKTIAAKTFMRLIDYERGRIAAGRVEFDGLDLMQLSARELRRLRGRKIAMVFQEPMTAFDPIFTIGSQLTETILRHEQVTRQETWKRSVDLLRRVGLSEPEARMHQYPGELSGGMLQRAMIAMALSCGPELLIADEPTTALDMTIQAQILRLLKELQREYGMAMLLITHDLGIAAEAADRIVVMYAGRVAEQADAHDLFREPLHPYTKGLLRSVTAPDSVRKSKLFSVEGSIPGLHELPSGCRFHPRCPHAVERCGSDIPELAEADGRLVACWRAEELRTAADVKGRPVVIEEVARAADIPGETLIEAVNVSKWYPLKRGAGGKARRFVRAVDDVSLAIRAGETFGLVGESGSGKSTLGRVILQLERATKGDVYFRGEPLTQLAGTRLRNMRRHMQMVFQDAGGSMNPRWKAGDIIGEPLDVHESLSRKERKARIEELLEIVGLSPDMAGRYPHQFSGGQRQRLGIARAIALNPAFLLLDEPVSALDVSVQAQIVNLLLDIQERMGLTYLFIGHGLHVVRHLSDRIGVMYLGQLVEVADSAELFLHPAHPYTKALIASIPHPDPAARGTAQPIAGEVPSPASPPSGCRFHPRCPAATERCKLEVPELKEVGPGHYAACHYPS
ncbi:MAG: glutathione ABC transporter ATP-binding protein [Paenibacillaceae bacterium]|nr:MAG: glutathione ABC transporter ATP-binding protein [Paenibacillaceae bacterium]